MRYSGDSDEQRDSSCWGDLLEEAKKHRIYIRPSDENRAFIMAGIKIKDRSET